jgi:2-polyprenyl-3-methyl-5-hydroxy-6-metoxy-1,4-benzoquinol methylase
VLFHVPGQELPQILSELHAMLKPGGVLFSSNPRGTGQEVWNGERDGAFYDWRAWHNHVSTAGFVKETHFYRPMNVPWPAACGESPCPDICSRAGPA